MNLLNFGGNTARFFVRFILLQDSSYHSSIWIRSKRSGPKRFERFPANCSSQLFSEPIVKRETRRKSTLSVFANELVMQTFSKLGEYRTYSQAAWTVVQVLARFSLQVRLVSLFKAFEDLLSLRLTCHLEPLAGQQLRVGNGWCELLTCEST